MSRMAGQAALLFTCEHGGNQVPRRFAPLFQGAGRVLASHRGYDCGALELARALAHGGAPLLFATITRLLVDLNRSLTNRAVFSTYTRDLEAGVREGIVAEFYRPYRERVEAQVDSAIASGQPLVHVSVHSFTPVRNGVRRRADVGLLFDPARENERRLVLAWQASLKELRPGLIVRRNYPYLGKSDGFTTHLRRRFGPRYAGIELEINQKWVSRATWPKLQRDLVRSFEQATSA
ncbi:MAG: N-formylglutamate amidohydrolase [Gemmataceae bacterium]